MRTSPTHTAHAAATTADLAIAHVPRRRFGFLLALLAMLAAGTGVASPNDGFGTTVTAINGSVRALAITQDGWIAAGGSFTGSSSQRLSWFHPNGEKMLYGAHQGVDNWIYAALVTSTGELLIGGAFDTVSGVARSKVALLNGMTPATFNAPISAGDVYSLAEFNDSATATRYFYIGGNFSQVHSLPRPRLARLHPSGNIDGGFVPPNFSGIVRAIQPLPDGKVLVAGSMPPLAGHGELGAVVFRLHADGSVDPDFTSPIPTAAGATVYAMAVQQDGRILIGGTFTATSRGGPEPQWINIARLLPDGAIDPDYNPPTVNGPVYAIALTRDERAVLGGTFTTPLPRAMRLYEDGGLDDGFPNLELNNTVRSIAVEPDGGVVLGGDFVSYSVGPLQRMIRVTGTNVPDRDLTFNGASACTACSALGATVHAAALEVSGTLLIGGNFTQINGSSRQRMARVRTLDGGIGVGFQPTFNADVRAIVVQPDERILVGGAFTEVGGSPRSRLVRLNSGGSIDISFAPSMGGVGIDDGEVRAIELGANGSILVGGSFLSIQGLHYPSLARFHDDGSLDTDYLAVDIDGAVNTIQMAGDETGRFYIGGEFTQVAGVARQGVARMLANGALDSSWTFAGVQGTVHAIALVPGRNQVLIGGDFSFVHPTTFRRRLVRVSTDNGLLDNDFASGFNDTVRSLTLDSAGRIVVGGDFSSVHSQARGRLVRLLDDGNVDTTFPDPVVGDDGIAQVHTLGVQHDGKVYFGGFGFWDVGTTPRRNFARYSVRSDAPFERIEWDRKTGTVRWLRDHGGSELVAEPQLLISEYCCANDDFQPVDDETKMRYGDDFQGWVQHGLLPPRGDFYLRVLARVGGGSGSSGLYRSPIYKFTTHADDDTIFANGFESD